MSKEKIKNWNISLILKGIGIYSISFVIASILLVGILSIIDKSSKKEMETDFIEKKILKVPQTINEEDKITYRKILSECLESKPILEHEECFEKKSNGVQTSELKEDKNIVNNTKNESFKILNKIINVDMFIQLMYLIMTFALVSQMSMYYIIKRGIDDALLEYVERYKFYLSDYNLNTPVTAGVVATMYSFGSFTFSSSTGVDLMEVFRANAFDAIATTVAGGSFYFIILRLNSTIQVGGNLK